MKFPYKRYPEDIIRPVIAIELANAGKTIRYEVLVDSGADICIFPAEIGEILDLDILSGASHEVAGITGQKECYYLHEVTLIVGGHRFYISAGFMPNFPRYSYGVVGQVGFFNNFVVRFDYAKHELEVKPLK